MEIRSLLDIDRAQLKGLIVQIYRENELAMNFAEEPGEGELNMVFDYKLSSMGDGRLFDFVALESERIVGECELLRQIHHLGMVGIIVDRDYRKSGVGSALLSKCLQEALANGVETAIAEVVEENAGAIAFFEKNGFSRIPGNESRVRKGKRLHTVILLQKRLV